MLGALLVVVALAAMAFAPVARAQHDAVRSEAPEAVLVLLRDGVARRAAGDDVGALERFEAARLLAPELGRTRAEIGLVQHALGRWVEAEASLLAALASDDPWVERHRSALLESLSIVRAHLVDATAIATDPEETLEPERATGEDTSSVAEPVSGGDDVRAGSGGAQDPSESHAEARAPEGPESSARTGASARLEPSGPPEPHALAWIGLATTLAGVAALVPTFVLALDAQSVEQAAFDARCPPPQTLACAPDHALAQTRLEPWARALDVLWSVVAAGGLLAAVGVGLSVVEGGRAPVAWTPSGVAVRF